MQPIAWHIILPVQRICWQVTALETFTRLESLQMDGCIGMTSVALNLPFLRHLSLDGCTALAQVSCRTLFILLGLFQESRKILHLFCFLSSFGMGQLADAAGCSRVTWRCAGIGHNTPLLVNVVSGYYVWCGTVR